MRMAGMTEGNGHAIDKVLFALSDINENYTAFAVFASGVSGEIIAARRNADVPIIIFREQYFAFAFVYTAKTNSALICRLAEFDEIKSAAVTCPGFVTKAIKRHSIL